MYFSYFFNIFILRNHKNNFKILKFIGIIFQRNVEYIFNPKGEIKFKELVLMIKF